MIIELRPVTTLKVPSHLTPQGKAQFLNELKVYLNDKRPRIVLDCSQIRRMDKEMISLLLLCLEEAMKCNGNVKLAALRPVAEGVVRYAGLHRLFEIFATTAEAEQSYQKHTSRKAIKEVNPGLPQELELQPALG